MRDRGVVAVSQLCICPISKMYLFKSTKVFVQWWSIVGEQETQGGGCCLSGLHLSNS